MPPTTDHKDPHDVARVSTTRPKVILPTKEHPWPEAPHGGSWSRHEDGSLELLEPSTDQEVSRAQSEPTGPRESEPTTTDVITARE